MATIKKVAERSEPEELSNDPREIIPEGSKEASVGVVLANDSLDQHDMETFTKDVQRYKIIRAKDPFNIYMVKETCGIGNLFPRLRLFKHLQQLKEETNLTIEKPLENMKLYLAFHQATKKWHRARLLHSNEKGNTVLVYFVDYPLLELAHVPVDKLRELPDAASVYSVVPVYKAHLYDVIPKSGGYVWKDEAVKWFKMQIKRGSIWMGLQMTWNSQLVHNGPDQRINVGVVLFEDNDHPDHSRSLNFRLVRCDYGKGIGIGATHFSNLYHPEDEPTFSLEKYTHLPNIDWCLDKLPLFVGNRWPQVAIRKVYGPHCINVFLMSKFKEFWAMRSDIVKIFKEGLPKVDKNHVKIGLGCLVAFKNLRTQRSDIHRSVVVKVIGPLTVEVLLVDEGEFFIVPISTLYSIPRRVKPIPAFLHRLHLNSIAPSYFPHSSLIPWLGNIDMEVERLIGEIGYGLPNGLHGREDGPAWFAVRSDIPQFNEGIAIRNVCGDLIFNRKTKMWGAEKAGVNNWDNFTQQMMIQSHVNSIGVDLLFLRKKKGSGEEKEELKWEFESLGEMIVGDKRRFAAELVEKKMDKKAYYNGLMK